MAKPSPDCTPALVSSSDEECASNLRFSLKLNRKYGKSIAPCWIDWVYVERSPLATHDDRPYGLFAERTFRSGEIIGVYMGGEIDPKAVKSKKNTSYILDGVADAGGGIDSGRPALLGMHFLNNPYYDGYGGGTRQISPKVKPNVIVDSVGVVTALHYIPKGQELLLDYKDKDGKKRDM